MNIAQEIIDCFSRGGKVILFGNGGSLADASHFAAEFHSLGHVLVLNDPIKITSIANDYSFEEIFVMQLHDTVRLGDLVIGISSSGKSENVNKALEKAKRMGVRTIDFSRQGKTTQEVQNYQYRLLHKIYLEVKHASL